MAACKDFEGRYNTGQQRHNRKTTTIIHKQDNTSVNSGYTGCTGPKRVAICLAQSD